MTKRTDAPSAAVKLRTLKRDRFRCTYCGQAGTDVELQVDHIIPVARGGSHHISNLTTACRECNQKKGAGAAPPPSRSLSAPVVPFDADLLVQAKVERVVYDLRRNTVEIHLEEGDCTDMGGAIALARRIDPNVRRVETFSGVYRDTSYSQLPGDQWQAFAGPRVVFGGPKP